jgi:hypothetical protein
MDLGFTRDRQYLSLRTAAALAYIGLVGKSPDPRNPLTLQRVLNDVAHAIAVLAPVRTYQGTGEGQPPVGIEPLDLIEGRFERGASALVCRDGAEVRQLVIQRRDLDAAISILSDGGLGKSLRDRYHSSS